MASAIYEKSFEGGGKLPEGQPVSEEEIAYLQEFPAALSFEEDMVGFDEDAMVIAAAMGQPVSVDITRFPFRATAYLDIFLDGGLRRRGSAFFVTPHVLATAGHNLNFPLGHVTQVDVIIDMHGGFLGATRYTAQYHQSHPTFTPGTREHDVGIVRLIEDVGSATGYFGLADAGAVGATIHVGGYPEGSFFQSVSAGSIQMATATRLHYDAATFGGQSGGVVLVPKLNPVDIVAVGVHTHGLVSGSAFNSGVRMNSDVKNWILGFA
jgi:glutamyl endopeptidase